MAREDTRYFRFQKLPESIKSKKDLASLTVGFAVSLNEEQVRTSVRKLPEASGSRGDALWQRGEWLRERCREKRGASPSCSRMNRVLLLATYRVKFINVGRGEHCL